MQKERNTGLDIFRITAALFVFLFHTNMHMWCNYGIFQHFIHMGAIFMTAFFMLSGFSLFYTYQDKDLTLLKNIKTFYLKRLIGIVPLYYLTSILYIIFLGQETLKENLLLAPIELLGLQTVFSNLFNISHNGGSWFVSCIILCYLIYPFIQSMVSQMSAKIKTFILFLLAFILLWAPMVVDSFNNNSIYASPFFRFLEFTIGILLCSLQPNINSFRFSKILFTVPVVVLEFLLLVLGVSYVEAQGFNDVNFVLYRRIGLPLFILLLLSVSGTRWSLLSKSKLIPYLSKISYAFYLAQMFTWHTAFFVLDKMIKSSNNLAKILVASITCLLISILLHELFEKPVSKLLKKILLK